MVFEILSPIAFEAHIDVYALKRANILAIKLRCTKVSQSNSSLLFANLFALFSPYFKRLPDLLCKIPVLDLKEGCPRSAYLSLISYYCSTIPFIPVIVCSLIDHIAKLYTHTVVQCGYCKLFRLTRKRCVITPCVSFCITFAVCGFLLICRRARTFLSLKYPRE